MLIISFAFTIIFYALICKRILDSREAKVKAESLGEREIPINNKQYHELIDLLKRGGPIIASVCNGWIEKVNEHHKRNTVPLYNIINSTTTKAYHFIRTKPDTVYLSENNKNLLRKIFELSDEYVIFFSEKDINKISELSSLIKGIRFVNDNGEKLYFSHTQNSHFYNYRILTLDNGECVIHIQENHPLPKPDRDEDEKDSDFEDFLKNGV